MIFDARSSVRTTQAIACYLHRIKEGLRGPRSRRARSKVSMHSYINTVNALLIPHAFVAVKDRLLHVVLLSKPYALQMSLQYAADVIWTFDHLNHRWSLKKDRTGKHALRTYPTYVQW